MRLPVALFPVGLLVLVSGCGLPGDSQTVSATALTELTAGTATLTIPNGALSEDTEMVFREVKAGKLGKDGREQVPVALVYEILPHDLSFELPVTLTFPMTSDATAALRVNGALTAVDGWQLAKQDDERSRTPFTGTDVDNDAGLAQITLTVDGGGYYWVAHEAIARPGLQANLGDKDEVLVDVEDIDLEEEVMTGVASFRNRTADLIFGVQITAGSRPLVAQPGTQALAQMNPDQSLGGGLTWMCIDDGPAEASASVTFQWTSNGGSIELREFRAVECYEEDIIIDNPDVPDLCPEPDGDAVISAEFESTSSTESLMVWDEGACQTVLSEVTDGVEQVYFRARPQTDTPQRARADYFLLSATLDGVPGDGNSTHPRVADVGNFAVFETQADNLIGEVEDTEVAIVKFFPDTLEPALIRRFDTNPAPTTSPSLAGNGQWLAAVSQNTVRTMDLRQNVPVANDFLSSARSPRFDKTGRYLAVITATDLGGGAVDTVESVYIADRDPNDDGLYNEEPTWILVSRLPDDSLPATVEVMAVTADGGSVLWLGDGSLYLTDVSGGRAITQLASVGPAGETGSDVVDADVSADGAFVVFTTDEWSTASTAVLEAWVRDIETGETALVSVDSDGNPADSDIFSPQIAPDGEVVALQTEAVLSPADTDGGPTVYRVPNPLGDVD